MSCSGMLFYCYRRDTIKSNEKIKSMEVVCLVNNLKTVIYERGLDITGDHICAICLSGLREGQNITIASVCKHSFHSDCLNEWLISDIGKRRCPVCNLELPEDSINKNSRALNQI